MNKRFNVIRINGFKGILTAVFILGCLVAGFVTFPGWVCMNVWNFFASMFISAPQMTLLHGVMLWGIIALSVFAINKGNLAISFNSAAPVPPSDERIKEILRKINEKNLSIAKSAKMEESTMSEEHSTDKDNVSDSVNVTDNIQK